MVMLTLEGVGVTLGRRTVLHDIHASLTAGTLVGIVGPNGAGKSTLARAIMALVPARGRIAIDGQPVGALPRADLARRIAYLPQGQTLHWPLTVERLVGLGRLPHLGPMSRLAETDAAAIEKAMERADVIDLRHRIATQLSGGERARVLLARALAVEAPALIADEPLASLDPGHQIDVMDLLHDQARHGALVIAVLHDLTMAARYCDRLILIDEGRLIADGSPRHVLTPDHLAMVYGIEAKVDMESAWPSIIPMGRRHG
ncbi:ABC transporter ATP-binding protein [Sphingobium lactosutens]|uniref:ABC transporter n=1 Tax=Sphingobium lactosutens DS20 TaxID=1331060 RepID=T0IYP3_9SPHN|nr:ATP-binding cassette domain-containing protein [Sphingobium lactosutens]EQB17010.1 ABC transporter [Sphingobium lactosutens DS20]